MVNSILDHDIQSIVEFIEFSLKSRLYKRTNKANVPWFIQIIFDNTKKEFIILMTMVHLHLLLVNAFISSIHITSCEPFYLHNRYII